MSFQYDQYLANHRANVKRGFDWLCENLPDVTNNISDAAWQIEFAHDKSKDEEDEYNAYDEYFYGNNRSYKVVQDYEKAWLIHIHRNPHHWQYWILIHDDMENGELETMHSNDKPDDEEKDKDSEDDETVEDVFDSLTEKQKTAVYAVIGTIMEDKENNDDSDDNEGGNDKMAMKHNVFENGVQAQAQDNTLSHADQVAILETAKMRTVGTFKNALQMYAEENALQHDATSSGVATGDLSKLFPEYAEVRPGAPELITNDQGWISTVISKVHKSPMSRIRTTQADIRNIDTLKAHGYQKGKQKKLAGNFNLVRRTTDPQTIYVKNALNRDDIVDITDFDYVAYLYSIDRMSLNEELAKAIMIGDGRDDGAEDKIFPEHIRPIWLDDDLYTIHTDLDITTMKAELQGTNTGANFGDNYVYAEAMVQTLLYARENYKGTGTPDLYCTPHMANVMLLARDLNGRRIYSSKAELATALNVGSINTAEQFANKTRKTSDGKTKKLIALVVNLQDYSLGATKGGEITHFTQFDIDFNQEKSLLETRCSGALTRVYSAIAIEEDVTDTKGQQTGDLAG